MRSTAELVEQARAGDADAITQLVQRYEHTLLFTAWAIVGDFHHAQYIAQESFVGAFRNLHQLRNSRAFGPWLIASVKRSANRKRKQLPREVHGLAMANVAESDDASWRKQFESLAPMLARLPEQERTVVSLRYLSGMPVKQIAEETDRPLGTVTKQLSRAIQRLQTMCSKVEE